MKLYQKEPPLHRHSKVALQPSFVLPIRAAWLLGNIRLSSQAHKCGEVLWKSLVFLTAWTLSFRCTFCDYFCKDLTVTATEITNWADVSEHTKEISWVTVSRVQINTELLMVWFSVCLSLLFILMSFTMRNWALACWSRLSCSDWLMLVKMPASRLKCNTLLWRFVRKWPKLRMQHTRTTHWTAWRKRDIKMKHERECKIHEC